MKILLLTVALVTSFSTFANDKTAYAAQIMNCFDEVSVQVSIGISQELKDAAPGSDEEMSAQAKSESFSEYLSTMTVMPTLCSEGTETEDDRLDCVIDNYSLEVTSLESDYNASDIVASTKSCELL